MCDDDEEAYLADDSPAPTFLSLRPDGWPATAPVLTAADLVWNFSTADGRRDLNGWLDAVFNPDYPLADSPHRVTADATLCAVIGERAAMPVPVLWLFAEQAYKAKKPSLAWQAACWNETLARLGYEVARAAARDPGGL